MKIDDLIKIMKEKAKKKKRTVVVGEGWDERCLKASHDVLKEGFADLILLGDEEKIKKEAKRFKADISKAKIIDPNTSELRKEFIKELTELRKHKGMTEKIAGDLLEDVNYFGCMLLHTGRADALAGSAICSTADLMRPALQIIKTKPGASLVSEVLVIDDPKNKRVLFMSDVSLNIAPDEAQLAQIAVNAADCAKSFNFDPKVAFLSFSTKGSGGDAQIIQKTREAVKIAQAKRPDYIFDGEMQGDAATNPYAAGRKCPDAKIKGDANVLIFPNLTAGNITLHLLTQLSDVKWSMSSLMGIKKPVMILGRSSPLKTVKNLIIMAAMEANANEKE